MQAWEDCFVRKSLLEMTDTGTLCAAETIYYLPTQPPSHLLFFFLHTLQQLHQEAKQQQDHLKSRPRAKYTTENALRRRPSQTFIPPPILLPEFAVSMPGETSEHYGIKAGEMIKRPVSPIAPTSPMRAYNPDRMYSPERAPMDFQSFPVAEPENIRGNAGLRRRPSNQPTSGSAQRSHSSGPYERERPSFSEGDSRRALRSRDDGYYRDEERERAVSRRDDYHPDTYERSRPPRAYRNDHIERTPGSASKPYFEETKGDRDLERGEWIPDRKRPVDEESIDGYNYDSHRSRERSLDFKNLSAAERAEVMRLPWTQWMNSDVKNRESPSPIEI